MTPSLQHVSALSLFVEDLAAAKAFYQDVFGVGVIYEDDTSVAVRFGNLIVNLLQVESAPEIVAPAEVARTGSRFQLSIWVPDVDAVHARLGELGLAVHGPINRPWGMRTINFVDPAGHSWEVAQRIEDSAG